MKRITAILLPNRADYFWVLMLTLLMTLVVSVLLLTFKTHFGFLKCTQWLSFCTTGIMLGITANLAWGRIDFRKSLLFFGFATASWALILLLKPYEIEFFGTGPLERVLWPTTIFQWTNFFNSHIEPSIIWSVLKSNVLFYASTGLLIFCLRWLSNKPRILALIATAVIAFIVGFEVYNSHKLSLLMGYATVEKAWEELRFIAFTSILFLACFLLSGAVAKSEKWWQVLLIWSSVIFANVYVWQSQAEIAINALACVSFVTILALFVTSSNTNASVHSQQVPIQWPSVASWATGVGCIAIISMVAVGIYNTKDESHAPAMTWRNKRTTLRIPANFSTAHRKATGAVYDFVAGEYGAYFKFRDMADDGSPTIFCNCELDAKSDPDALQFVVDNFREDLQLAIYFATPKLNTALVRELDKQNLIVAESKLTKQQLSDLLHNSGGDVYISNVALIDNDDPIEPAIHSTNSIKFSLYDGSGHLPALFAAIGNAPKTNVEINSEINLDDWKAALEASRKFDVKLFAYLPEGAMLSDIKDFHKLEYEDPNELCP